MPTTKLIKEILDSVRASYPKSQTQEEHNKNMKIVDDAINEAKLWLREKLTNLEEIAYQKGYRDGVKKTTEQTESMNDLAIKIIKKNLSTNQTKEE